MPASPLVSIITPSYNQAKFLEQTLLSVLGQEYPNLEYMVVDGGSNDGSREIIERYSSRLSWWVSEKDKGQAEAINKGFKRVKGEIIGWVNSDDFYMPGTISDVVRVFAENPDIGLVFGNVKVVDENEQVVNLLQYGDWTIRDLMRFRIIGQPAVFFRKSVLEMSGGLDLSFHLLLDHHLWLRMALNTKIKYHPALWAGAHYHEDCKNLAMASEFGAEAQRIVSWMKSDERFSAFLGENLKQVEAGAERLNAFYLLDAKEYGASFKAYWKALRLDAKTVKPEWYRMLYAFLGPLGLEKLKAAYLNNRRKKFKS